MFFFYSCLYNDKEWKSTGEKCDLKSLPICFYFFTYSVEIQTQTDAFPFLPLGYKYLAFQKSTELVISLFFHSEVLYL